MDFEKFVVESHGSLMRFAASVTDDVHTAQDIVHEVLLRAQGRWDHIDSMQYPAAYVRRMIINEARSGWRRGRRIEPRAEVDIGASTIDHALTYERRDELERQLLRLSTKQRAAVVMRYLEDLPDAEIAEALNCSLSTVRVHIHRALARMRVDPDGASAPSAATPARRRRPLLTSSERHAHVHPR